jgi:hypothetical protein
MKTFAIQVRTATGVHAWTQLARTGAEAFMAAWDRFGSESLAITIKGGRP